MSNRPEISVIIVSYNTRQLLKDCLQSIAEKTSITVEIIVVDNASHDGSVAMVKEDFPTVKCIENGNNKGFGAANNIGLKLASSPFVCFLNPDTLLVNDALSILVNYLKDPKNSSVGAVGGALFNADMTSQISFGRFPGFKSVVFEFFLRGLFTRYYEQHVAMAGYVQTDHPISVDYITGADLVVRRELTQKFGGFDEDFFLFFEESELCHRLGKAGYRNVILPEAQIIHLCGKSTELSPGLSKIQWFEDSRFKFFRKTRGTKYARYMLKFIHGLYHLASKLKRNNELWQNRVIALQKIKANNDE